MGNAKTVRCAGVAFFGMSVEADLKALEWAYNHLPVSDVYKLRIIHLKELQNGNQPHERLGSRCSFGDVPAKFLENYPEYSDKMDDLKNQWIGHNKVHKYICGVAYDGGNFEATLEYAIQKERERPEGLDVLVLAWWEADDDDGTKGPPITINRLQSAGCSVVFANVDSRNLTLPMPSTQTMSATMASMEEPAAPAAPSLSMPAALLDQSSNNGTRSTSSGANTRYPDGRAPAASAQVSESNTTASAQPVTAPTKRPELTIATTKRSGKASASGSETDDSTRRLAGRDKKVMAGSAAPNKGHAYSG